MANPREPWARRTATHSRANMIVNRRAANRAATAIPRNLTDPNRKEKTSHGSFHPYAKNCGAPGAHPSGGAARHYNQRRDLRDGRFSHRIEGRNHDSGAGSDLRDRDRDYVRNHAGTTPTTTPGNTVGTAPATTPDTTPPTTVGTIGTVTPWHPNPVAISVGPPPTTSVMAPTAESLFGPTPG